MKEQALERFRKLFNELSDPDKVIVSEILMIIITEKFEASIEAEKEIKRS